MDYDKLALELHEKYRGKITTLSAITLSLTAPNSAPTIHLVLQQLVVASPMTLTTTDPHLTNNLVAVISDGSAVLGLGDIGLQAPVCLGMEGKALFKHFANIDAVPIILDVHTPDEIVAASKQSHRVLVLSTSEDIAATAVL